MFYDNNNNNNNYYYHNNYNNNNIFACYEINFSPGNVSVFFLQVFSVNTEKPKTMVLA